MIVITCNCDAMSRELIAEVIGHDEFELVNKYPGGALQLQNGLKGTLEYKDTLREFARKILDLDEQGIKQVQTIFAIHGSCDFTLNARQYPWRPTGAGGQLRGLTNLLDDAEKAIESHFIHPPVLPVRRMLYVNEVETGIFWIDFTDPNNPIRIERSEE